MESSAKNPQELEEPSLEDLGEEILIEALMSFFFFFALWVSAQSLPNFGGPMDFSPPGASVLGIFQAGVLERIAISYSRGSNWLT